MRTITNTNLLSSGSWVVVSACPPSTSFTLSVLVDSDLSTNNRVRNVLSFRAYSTPCQSCQAWRLGPYPCLFRASFFFVLSCARASASVLAFAFSPFLLRPTAVRDVIPPPTGLLRNVVHWRSSATHFLLMFRYAWMTALQLICGLSVTTVSWPVDCLEASIDASLIKTLIFASSSSFDPVKSYMFIFKLPRHPDSSNLVCCSPWWSTHCSIASPRPAAFGALSAISHIHASNPCRIATPSISRRLRPVMRVAIKTYSVGFEILIRSDVSLEVVDMIVNVGLDFQEELRVSLVRKREEILELELELVSVLHISSARGRIRDQLQ